MLGPILLGRLNHVLPKTSICLHPFPSFYNIASSPKALPIPPSPVDTQPSNFQSLYTFVDMIPRLSSLTHSPPGTGPNLLEPQGVISLGGANWMLPRAISATVVSVKLSLPLGTYFESRLEVTDNEAAICSTSTSSFYVGCGVHLQVMKKVFGFGLGRYHVTASPIAPLPSSVP